MSLSGTIIVKKKGFEVPLDFLKLAMSNNQTCAGFAMIGKHKEDDAKEVLLGHSILGASDLNKVQTIQSKFKDKNLIMYFGSSANAVSRQVVPPYPVLLDKDGKPLILAFLDGDCSQFHRADSSHPDIYNAVENDLKPRMKDWYDDADGDLTKLMDKISKSATKRADIERLFKGNGALCLYTAADDIKFFHSVEKNTYADFDWGQTSNAYGFDGVKSVPKKEEPKAQAAGPFSSLSESDDLDDSIGTSTKEPSKSPAGGDNPPKEGEAGNKVDDSPKPDAVANPKKGMTKLWLEAPKDWKTRNNKDRKGYLRSKGIDGNKYSRPDGWDSNDCKGFPLEVRSEDVHKWTARGFVVIQQPVSSKSAPPSSGKDVAPHHIPQIVAKTGATKSVSKPSEADDMDDSIGKPGGGTKPAQPSGSPADTEKEKILQWASNHIMPPKQREAIDTWLKSSEYAKFTGHGSEPLAGDPRALRLGDGEIEDFCKQCGLNLEDTFNWPLDMLVDLGEKFGYTALALLAISYRAAYKAALSEAGGEAGEVQPNVNEQAAKRAGWLR